MINNKEKRFVKLKSDKSIRAKINKDGSKYIEGYASVFNQRSKLIFENGKEFYEIIEKNAFDKVLKSKDLDVLLTYQHNLNEPIARLNTAKAINNLTLTVDEKGLKYSAKLPNTRLANDVFELIKSGSLFENSFIFTVGSERWTKDSKGNNIRYIESVKGLFDASVVVNASYSNTDLSVAERKLEENVDELEKMKLTIKRLNSDCRFITELESDKLTIKRLRE
jgi:HK97 family phage prohead protease